MKTNQILLLLGGAAIAYGLYAMNRTPQPPAGWQGANYIPPGGTWQGMANGTNQPVWVQVTGGVLSAVNAAGQILSQIPWNQLGGGYTGGNNNPQSGNGQWVDNGQGAIVWQAN